MSIPVVSAICLPLGLLAVAWAVLAYRSARRFLSTAVATNGTIQSLRAERIDRTTVYFPVISFTTASGNTVTAESKSSRTGGYRVGQPISILYDPRNPTNLEINAAWSRWFFVAVAIAFAVVLFAIGVVGLVLNQASSGGNLQG